MPSIFLSGDLINSTNPKWSIKKDHHSTKKFERRSLAAKPPTIKPPTPPNAKRPDMA